VFHLNISKVDWVLHTLQWRRWLADSGLPQGFDYYLVWRASPSPLPSLPFPPFHLGVGVGVGVIEGAAFGRRRWRGMGCEVRGAGDAMREQCQDESCGQTSGR